MNSIGLYIYRIFSCVIPETRLFGMKRFALRLCGAKVGKNVRIASSARFLGSGELEIGDDTWIGHYALICAAGAKISIGRCVDIAPSVYIGTGTHEIDVQGDHVAGLGHNNEILIGNGAWLCARSVILSGVSIGEKSVIAAGSVVIKSVPAKKLVGGVPAAILRDLNA